MAENLTHLLLSPADDVTDLDEWYARLDSAVPIGGDVRWHCDAHGVAAELPDEEAAEVVERARAVLGDAVVVEQDDRATSVLIGEVAGGRALDE